MLGGLRLASSSEKKKGKGCQKPMSPWHGTDGKFVDPDKEKAGSWSCQEKGQTSRRGRSQRFTKVPCGRKARAQKKNVRCHDGKVMEEDLFNYIKGMVEEELVLMRREADEQLVDEVQEYERLHIPTLKRSFRDEISNSEDGLLDEQDCSQCVKNYLMSLNAAIRASKGDLIDKK